MEVTTLISDWLKVTAKELYIITQSHVQHTAQQ